MQMPTQKPRLEIARIEERLGSPALIFAYRTLCLRQVAAGTTERQVAHHGLAALGSRQDVFDVEGNSGSGLEQATILTHPTCAGHDEFPERFRLRHALALRVFGLNPNRDGHRTRTRTHRFALSKLRQPLGISNHELFRVSDKLIQFRFLRGRNRAFAVFIKQLVHTLLLSGTELFESRRHRFLHGFSLYVDLIICSA
jgi:hypothetical protein